MQTVRKRRQRLTFLVAGLAGAMAAILAACAGIIVWILHVSAVSLDATKQQDERRLLRVIVDTQRKSLAKTLEDYSNWKELYDDLEGPRHAAWEKDNLGPYLATSFGVDHVFVTGRNGRSIYVFDKAGDAGLPASDRKAVARLSLLAFRVEPRDDQKAVAGIVSIHGRPALAAATTIRATTFRVRSHFAVVVLREFNPAYLAALGQDYGIANLRAAPGEKAGGALRAVNGRPAPFHLVWTASAQGRTLFADVLPVVLTAIAAVLLAFAGVLLAWWRIAEHLRLGEKQILNAELSASNARAEAAEETSRSKSAFIANMSHELRTPLNAIIGFSELISSEVLGPLQPVKYRDYIEDIRTSGTHLLRIVEDVLHVSRIEAGRFDPAPERLAIGEAVAEALRMIEVLAAKRDISFEAAGAPDLEVVADRTALRQILLNTLSNAVKFSNRGGTIAIAWNRVAAEACEIRVSDRGCGIPAKTLKELGKPFVQAEGAYSRKHQGTGLGLAICFRLAEAMGGSIAVTSQVDFGTTVHVRLPAFAGRSAHAPERAEMAA